MSEFIVTIDGGTSNTRLRLLKDGNIIDSFTANIGANSINNDGSHKVLIEIIKELVDTIIQKHHCAISCFLGSGMITSNIGLINIPHLQAPFEPDKVNLKPLYFKEIHDAPFYFIPGVKFGGEEGNILHSDLAKGEETEVYGILKDTDYRKNILIIHFGTHNKAIFVENGKIAQCITTIGGELLNAIVSNTIIKNSVCDFDDLILENEYVLEGYENAKKVGLSRALFLGRVGEVVYKMKKTQIFSIVYGAVVQSDFLAFNELLQKNYDKIIIYGREHFNQAFKICMQKEHEDKMNLLEQISYEESEFLSTNGLYKIYLNCKQLEG